MQTSARESFDALHLEAAARLTWQTYLLTGHRHRAAHCVRRAFQLAWSNWSVVSSDESPEGWVRARAMELALSPWHRGGPRMQHLVRLPHRQLRVPDDSPAHLGLRDRALLRALLRLPRPQRQALVLHDVIGLDWKQTAAEAESSTPAAYGRVTRARATLARTVPALVGDDPSSPGFGRRLGRQARAAATRACGAESQPVHPARTRLRARLHDRGVTVAAGVLTVATVATLVGVAQDGGTFRRETPVAVPPKPAAAPAVLKAPAPARVESADPGLAQQAPFPLTPLHVPTRTAQNRPPALSLCGLFAIPCGRHH